MNQLLVEKAQIVPAIMPSNLASGGATGDVVSLKNYYRCTILILKAVGAASQDPTFTLLQGTDVAFGTSKALNFSRVDSKIASALAAVAQFTTATPAAGNTFTSATLGENQALIAIEVNADDLDVANGYCCLRLSVDDPGTSSQLCAAIYILHEPRYQSGTLPGAIAD